MRLKLLWYFIFLIYLFCIKSLIYWSIHLSLELCYNYIIDVQATNAIVFCLRNERPKIHDVSIN